MHLCLQAPSCVRSQAGQEQERPAWRANGKIGVRLAQAAMRQSHSPVPGWLEQAGLRHHTSALSRLDVDQFRGLLMQDYAKFGVHETEDKQKLFRLIKKVSSEPTGHSAQDMRPSPRQTGSSVSELSAAAVKARQLDGNLALLDLDEQDDDVLVKGAVGVAQPRHGMSAAAQFVEQSNPPRIRVVVRKRPLNSKEIDKGEEDAIEVDMKQAVLVVNEPKVKVDLTKYLERHTFSFDDCLNDNVTNDEVYRTTVQPLVATIFKNGKATCFAYGQTGSGKTYTMQPLPVRAAADMFTLLADPRYEDLQLWVSCFEIYGGKLYDLLNGRKRLEVREDGRKRVCIVGVKDFMVEDVTTIQQLIEHSSAARSTGSTGANADSSRSHSIMQFVLKRSKPEGKGTEESSSVGKISFIDLAGSERGADTYDNDRQTRLEGAEINKSLLALKECIRALDNVARHVPFRGSKLTEVLRDSFVGEEARTVMIANVSPNSSSCEHTLNTLRYADRVKELRKEKSARLQGYLNGVLPSSNAALTGLVPPVTAQIKPPVPMVDAKVRGFAPGAVRYPTPPQGLRAPSPPRGAALRAPSPPPPVRQRSVTPLRNMPSLAAAAARRSITPEKLRSPGQGARPAEAHARQRVAEDAVHRGPRLSGNAAAGPAAAARMSSDDGRLRYYEDTGDEDSMLLYQRDELMNSILEDEDALITEHRKQIEYTMTIVRLEMSLLTEVDQPGSAIDVYVEKLAGILEEKAAMMALLKQRMESFQAKLKEEEQLSKTVQTRRVC